MEAGELEGALRSILAGWAHEAVPFPAGVDSAAVLGSAADPLPMLVPAASRPSPGEVPYFFHVSGNALTWTPSARTFV